MKDDELYERADVVVERDFDLAFSVPLSWYYWISIEDELPPMGYRFDAWTIQNERIDHGPFLGSWNKACRRDNLRIKGITHWCLHTSPQIQATLKHIGQTNGQ